MKTMTNNNRKQQRGATMIEYVLLAALIAIAAIAALRTLGESVSGTFEKVDQGIQGEAGAGGGDTGGGDTGGGESGGGGETATA